MDFKRVYRAVIREGIKPLFGFFERLGVHVTPIHFYQPIPDTASLDSVIWTRRSAMVGIDLRDSAQLALLAKLSESYKAEYNAFPRDDTGDPSAFYLLNRSFEKIDAEIYYAMLREVKPKRLIEIGSGNSTLLAAQALAKNRADGSECEFTVIDPFPRPIVEKGLPGVTRLIRQGVEDVDLSVFDQLDDGDILFIDSSHVVRIGGDVVFEYLELLPRLKPGVLVHIHDIFLPMEYPKNLIDKDRWFWTEQYLLQAFLAFNDSFEVIWAGSYMTLTHSAEMQAAFASFSNGVNAGSFWIRRKS
jgi:predicted O-methyltransferase YrrM